MNAAELPMIIFTVLAQMSVGAFVVLGLLQTFATARFSTQDVDRIADPALFAIGPTLVLGLVASTFHMHDPFHVLNVFRHLGSSWLSREIVFGMLFAGAGFVFAVMQWRKWGGPRLRQLVAAVTAVFGIALVYSMSQIYASLVNVPAWHTWATPLQFFTTTVLLGSLAVATAIMLSTVWRRRRQTPDTDDTTGAEGSTSVNHRLVSVSIRVLTVLAVVASAGVLIGMPAHVALLAGDPSHAARESLHAFTTVWFVVRLGLTLLGAGLMTVFSYGLASDERANAGKLALVVAAALVMCFIGEFIGRTQFYESFASVGI